MKIDVHQKNLKESIEILEDCIQKNLFIERRRTIGFHTSAASIDMLEILLHKRNLIEPGMLIKHDWFSSKRKASEKIRFDFPKKEKIVSLIVSIEEKRNLLCYGKPQPEKTITEVISKFQELREVAEDLGVFDVE